eukprot:11262767-Alexandrium_andersonii.AAC.1
MNGLDQIKIAVVVSKQHKWHLGARRELREHIVEKLIGLSTPGRVPRSIRPPIHRDELDREGS